MSVTLKEEMSLNLGYLKTYLFCYMSKIMFIEFVEVIK